MVGDLGMGLWGGVHPSGGTRRHRLIVASATRTKFF